MKVISIDLGTISQYSINGSDDVFVISQAKNSKGNKVFSIESFIQQYIDILKEEKPDIVVFEAAGGWMSKFAARTLYLAQGSIMSLCSILEIKIIKVGISWNKAYPDKDKNLDAKYLYKYAKTKKLI